ncbi:hypothetical protein GKQ38_00810 [Candidatus Nanohaloarchaea archaeon]|nr:hypothetical protein GKQ38_00810 [Candidatus Nanohaloarchaea archaeon]
MRIQKYQPGSYSRLSYSCYRFSFRDQRLRLVLMEFCEESSRRHDYRKMDDFEIIKEIYNENKQVLADFFDIEPDEVTELGHYLVENGKEAKKHYSKAEELKEQVKKYNKKDEGKKERAEKLEEPIREWEQEVEKSVKEAFSDLGFISTEEFSSSEGKVDAIGEATSENQITSDYVQDRVQTMEELIYGGDEL